MKKKTKYSYFIFFTIVILYSINISGQENKITKNIIHYEFYGTGFGVFSLNYERNIPLGEKIHFAPSIGLSSGQYIHVGGTYSINNYQLFMPVQINFIFGEHKHHFETGFGMPIAIKNNEFGLVGKIYVLRFAYRYQDTKSPFIFRASFNPAVIVVLPTLMGGISIGYKFKKKRTPVRQRSFQIVKRI